MPKVDENEMEKASNTGDAKDRGPSSTATAAAATPRAAATQREAAPPAAETTSPAATTAAALEAAAGRIRAATSAERGKPLYSRSFPASPSAASLVAKRGAKTQQQQQQLKEIRSSGSNNSKQQQQQGPAGRPQQQQQHIQPRQQQQQRQQLTRGSSPLLLPQWQQQCPVQQTPEKGNAELIQQHQHEKREQQITKQVQRQGGEVQGEPKKTKRSDEFKLDRAEPKKEKQLPKDTQQKEKQPTKRENKDKEKREQQKERERMETQAQREEEEEKQLREEEKGKKLEKKQQQEVEGEKEDEEENKHQQEAEEKQGRQAGEEQAEEKKIFGSGIQTVGGETPVEQSPEEKFVVERDTLLCESILWKMLQEYYKQVAIAAWSQEVVPSFVTSNSRLCRSYARIIFGFLQDWYAKAKKERKEQEAEGQGRRGKVEGVRRKREKKENDVPDAKEEQQQRREQLEEPRDRQRRQEQEENEKIEQRQQAAVEKQPREKEKHRRHRGPEKQRQKILQEQKKEGKPEEKEESFACGTARSSQEDVLTQLGTNEMLVWQQVLPSSGAPAGAASSSSPSAFPADAAPVATVATATAACAAPRAGGSPAEAADSRASVPAGAVAAASPPTSGPPGPAAVAGAPGKFSCSSSSFPSSSAADAAAAGSERPWTAATEQQPRVLILEIGGGHGRFTFLLLKALLQFRSLFADLDLPPFPFLYVFSDVAAANVCFCEQHPALQPYVDDGWLDFSIFDGNDSKGEIFLRKRKKFVAKGTPIVAIANYVFDSLLTDAWRITPGAEAEYHRAGISIYSPRVEKDRLHPDIMLRMSVGWHWHPVKQLSDVFPSVEPDGATADAGAAAAGDVSADPAAAAGAFLTPAAAEPVVEPAGGAGPCNSFPPAAASSSAAAACVVPFPSPLPSPPQLSAPAPLQSSAAAVAAREEGCCADAGGKTLAGTDHAAAAAANPFLVSCSQVCNAPLVELQTEEKEEGSSSSVVLGSSRSRNKTDDKEKEKQQHQEEEEGRQSEGSREFEAQTKEKHREDAVLPPTANSSRKSSSSTHNRCSQGSSRVSSTSSSVSNSRSNFFNHQGSCGTSRSSSPSPYTSSRSFSSVSFPSVTSSTSSSTSSSSTCSSSSRCSWKTDPAVRRVLEKYREMNRVLSLVLPVGAFSLFRTLLQLSGYNFFCLIGDKGYPSPEEFAGERDPHIAVHGSVSFMLNLHAIRLYFDCVGGFSMATPYRDTFQVTALWCCSGKCDHGSRSEDRSSGGVGERSRNCKRISSSSSKNSSGRESKSSRSSSRCRKEMPRSQAAFLADAEDMPPDSLIQWQRSCQEREVGIKEALALLRYSGHDPDVFLNLSSSIVKQCVQPFINPRTEQDILLDLKKVHENWYKLKKGEDLPDACAHVCMKLGHCTPAIHYLKASTAQCTETLHASTFVNLAACYKVLGQFQEGIRCCEQALLLQPHYSQAQEMLSTLQMCQRPFRVALVGLGYWMRMEAAHLLRREKRVQIAAVYSYKEADACRFVSLALTNPEEEQGEEKIDVYAGAAGLKQLLQRTDIHAVVLDVHAQLTPWFLCRVLQSKKHILTRSPLALSLSTGWKLVNMYKPHAAQVVWHAVDNARSEEAFFQAKELLQQIGSLSSFSFHCITQTLIPPAATTPAAAAAELSTFPYSVKEHLALELLRCIVAVRTITGEQLLGLGCVFTGSEATAGGGEEKGKEDAEGREEEVLYSSSDERQTCSAAHVADGRPGAVAAADSLPVAASGAPPAHGKRTPVQQKDSPLLTGWLELSDARDCSRRIPGSFVVTNAAGDSSIKYTFLCTGGALELTRSVSSWKLKWTNEDSFFSAGAHSIAMQTIGHQNSHDAWLTDLFHAMCRGEEAEKKQTTADEKDENWGLVDVTINAALADCAIIEAILGSIEKEGSPARFTAVNKMLS